MSTPEIPFDVSYVMPDGLRARPNDPQAMAAAVEWLLARAEEADAPALNVPGCSVSRARMRGILRQVDRVAALLREAIDPVGAVAHLEQALALRARRGDADLIESSRAALATARQSDEG